MIFCLQHFLTDTWILPLPNPLLLISSYPYPFICHSNICESINLVVSFLIRRAVKNNIICLVLSCILCIFYLQVLDKLYLVVLYSTLFYNLIYCTGIIIGVSNMQGFLYVFFKNWNMYHQFCPII